MCKEEIAIALTKIYIEHLSVRIQNATPDANSARAKDVAKAYNYFLEVASNPNSESQSSPED